MSYLRCLCLFVIACSGFLAHWLYEHYGGCLLRCRNDFPFMWACDSSSFGEVHVAHHFSIMCCVVCFVCLRPVSYVSTVASFSWLSIQIILGVVGNTVFFNVYLKHCKDSWNKQMHIKIAWNTFSNWQDSFFLLSKSQQLRVFLTRCRTIHGRVIC
jgi:hypothetical protein